MDSIRDVLIYVDYAAPVGIIRKKLTEIVKNSKNWDGNVINLQVTDAKEQVMELRHLMSARSATLSIYAARCAKS